MTDDALKRVLSKYLVKVSRVEGLINATDKHVHYNADGSIADECVLKSDLRSVIGVLYDGTEDDGPQTWERNSRDDITKGDDHG